MLIFKILTENFLRLAALVCLLIGLGDAARLLGVHGAGNPLEQMGAAAFVVLSLLALARLFAAVGMWIEASWGVALLICATIVEVGVHVAGVLRIEGGLQMGVRIALVLCAGGLLAWQWWRHRESVHD